MTRSDGGQAQRPRTGTAEALPTAGRIRVSRVATLPRPGRLPSPVVHRARPAGSIPVPRPVGPRPPGSIGVDRPFSTPPRPGTSPVTAAGADAGRSDRGNVTIDDRVVVKIASRAAAENPDVGGVATKVLGATVPGLDRLGGRATALDSLPKTTAETDGTQAYLAIELSVRYPAPLPATTAAVRRTVSERVHVLTGLEVAEVDIVVGALVTDLPASPRVR